MRSRRQPMATALLLLLLALLPLLLLLLLLLLRGHHPRLLHDYYDEQQQQLQQHKVTREITTTTTRSKASWGELDVTDELVGQVLDELRQMEQQLSQLQQQQQHKSEQQQQQQQLPTKRPTTTKAGGEGEEEVHMVAGQGVGERVMELLLFSVRRASLLDFTAVGVASMRHWRRRKRIGGAGSGDAVRSCAWAPAGNRSRLLWGAATTAYVNDSSDYPTPSSIDRQRAEEDEFMVAVLRCSFSAPVGADAAGGVLLLNAASRGSVNGGAGEVVNGATGEGVNGGELVAVLEEAPEEISRMQLDKTEQQQVQLAYCSPPLRWRVSAEAVAQWADYHDAVAGGGGALLRYHVYDAGGMHAAAELALRRRRADMTSGGAAANSSVGRRAVTVVRMQAAEAALLAAGVSGAQQRRRLLHHLALNHCLQRTRSTAAWTFSWGLGDEYIHILSANPAAADHPAAFPTMIDLLRPHRGKPWVSLGSLIWSRTYCCDDDSGAAGNGGGIFESNVNGTMGDDRWMVEMMQMRLAAPTCGEARRADVCHGSEGRRRWIADASAVTAAAVHRTVEPEWGGGQLLSAAAVARINAYTALHLERPPPPPNCAVRLQLSSIVNGSSSTKPLHGWWHHDSSASAAARAARLRH